MRINIESYLSAFVNESNLPAIHMDSLQLPDKEIKTEHVKVIMINEVPPQNPNDFFYCDNNSENMTSAKSLFQKAGVNVETIDDILELGIYITTAVKSPKTEYAVDSQLIKSHLPLLEKELDLFPNLQAVMLMGDVAKKSFNMIAKNRTKKNAIPSGSTYKLRENEYYFGDIRVFPSYIMTGGNILIEKSKVAMITDDLRKMLSLYILRK